MIGKLDFYGFFRRVDRLVLHFDLKRLLAVVKL